MKQKIKMMMAISICIFLLCGCKKEEIIEESTEPSIPDIETSLFVPIEPEVTITEKKGDTEIHIELEETIPERAYVSLDEKEDSEIEEKLFDITPEMIEKMSSEDFKNYVIALYQYWTPDIAEEDLLKIRNMSEEDVKAVKQIMIDEINHEG